VLAAGEENEEEIQTAGFGKKEEELKTFYEPQPTVGNKE